MKNIFIYLSLFLFLSSCSLSDFQKSNTNDNITNSSVETENDTDIFSKYSEEIKEIELSDKKNTSKSRYIMNKMSLLYDDIREGEYGNFVYEKIIVSYEDLLFSIIDSGVDIDVQTLTEYKLLILANYPWKRFDEILEKLKSSKMFYSFNMWREFTDEEVESVINSLNAMSKDDVYHNE